MLYIFLTRSIAKHVPVVQNSKGLSRVTRKFLHGFMKLTWKKDPARNVKFGQAYIKKINNYTTLELLY
jgi:hypothetical protein